jgi:hypothetical protein
MFESQFAPEFTATAPSSNLLPPYVLVIILAVASYGLTPNVTAAGVEFVAVAGHDITTVVPVILTM